MLNKLNEERKEELLTIVTKAKKNCTAYQLPPPREQGKKGRPLKKGDPVKIMSLFNDPCVKFRKARVTAYGEKKDVEYYCINLLWD